MSDDRITKKAPYGAMIGLICKNHPELSWSTKNIGNANEDGTGVYMARSIFFNHFPSEECECSAKDLIVSPKIMVRENVPA